MVVSAINSSTTDAEKGGLSIKGYVWLHNGLITITNHAAWATGDSVSDT